jgi:hypothetical protein
MRRIVRRPTGVARVAPWTRFRGARFSGRCDGCGNPLGRRHGRTPCRRGACLGGTADGRASPGYAGSYRASARASCTHARWRSSRRPRARPCDRRSGAAWCRAFHEPLGSAPSRRPPFGPDARSVERNARPVDLVGSSKLVEEHLVQPPPHPLELPVTQPPPARHPTSAPHLSWQILPADPRTQHEEDPRQRGTMVDGRAPTARPRLRGWNDWL